MNELQIFKKKLLQGSVVRNVKRNHDTPYDAFSVD